MAQLMQHRALLGEEYEQRQSQRDPEPAHSPTEDKAAALESIRVGRERLGARAGPGSQCEIVSAGESCRSAPAVLVAPVA